MGIKTEISGDWLERFNDVEKFNAYASENKVKLSDAIIKNKEINGVILTGASFKNTEWEQVDFSNNHITATQFEDSVFTEVDFKHSTMTDVVFKDCKFVETEFDESKLMNVKFINCVFERSDFFKISQSNVEFLDSSLERVTFNKAQANLFFSGTKLVRTHLTSLKPPSSLTFENGELDFDLRRSTLDKLSITGSTLNDPGGSDVSIRELTLKEVKGERIALTKTTIDTATIESSELEERGLAIPDADIKSLTIVGANHGVVSIDGNHGNVKIINSTIPMLDFDGATIGSLLIQNSKIEDGMFENMKAKKLEFENVTLDGKMNFKNAQVDQFINKNTTRTANTVIDLTGSNIKF